MPEENKRQGPPKLSELRVKRIPAANTKDLQELARRIDPLREQQGQILDNLDQQLQGRSDMNSHQRSAFDQAKAKALEHIAEAFMWAEKAVTL